MMTTAMSSSDDEAYQQLSADSRWPMVGAVVAAMILTILLPAHLRLGPSWLVPSIEVILLVVLIVGDPGAVTRRSRVLRPISIALVSLLVLSTLWVTIQLVGDLIQGGPETNSAEDVLEAGAVVWASNCIAFALLYWQLDSGGAAARAHSPRRYPDFAFVQHVNPDLAPEGWRPRFLDYLYLGYTNATAFSPTDVMPLAAWAKLAMMLQSLISLIILGLVIARAVNVFS
jgi:uncharacterized membrane protein